MGLFDDLLKKPPQPSSGDTSSGTGSAGQSSGSSGQQDVLLQHEAPLIKIEKTSEQSIMTESVNPTQAFITNPQVPNTSPITVENDASGILVNGEALKNTTPLTTPSKWFSGEPVPISTTIKATTAPIVTEVVATTAPIVTEDSSTPLTIPSETPIAPMVDLATSESVGIGNLFGDSSVTTDAEVDALISTPEPETSEVTIAIPTAEDTGLSSIIAGEEGEEEKATEEFTHLRDYIKANIEQANIMIEKFNNSRKAELEEAAQYKSEKERFAKLEEDAYVNAEKLVAETAHAESMKTYFVEELKKEQPSPDEIEVLLEENTASVSSSPSEDFPIMDEPPMDEDIMLIDDTSIDGSVETALTGMAVQNTVNKTMDKKHKAKVKKEELFSLV